MCIPGPRHGRTRPADGRHSQRTTPISLCRDVLPAALATQLPCRDTAVWRSELAAIASSSAAHPRVESYCKTSSPGVCGRSRAHKIKQILIVAILGTRSQLELPRTQTERSSNNGAQIEKAPVDPGGARPTGFGKSLCGTSARGSLTTQPAVRTTACESALGAIAALAWANAQGAQASEGASPLECT